VGVELADGCVQEGFSGLLGASIAFGLGPALIDQLFDDLPIIRL
jgi:hypothetical protein